jgi:uncharacterized protein (TIGR04255 family)
MDALPLPRFRKPPLIEVVHGVQFRRLPMTIVHPGLFYLKLKDKFPVVRTVPPLPTLPESAEEESYSMPPRLEFIEPTEMPRAWFISADDAMVVQIQSDRLLLNWRRGGGGVEYPHFESVTSEFQKIYRIFENFLASEEIGSIEPNYCEITYINHLESIAHGNAPEPYKYIRGWVQDAGREWNSRPDSISLNVRYLLRDDTRFVGTLHAALATISRSRGHDRVLQLDLTARGKPSRPEMGGVIDFHEFAHDHIVRCFAGMTTESAHRMWERYQ